ncbi:hypothetical protein ACGFI9_34575 [Micromonospora sp. NPDC048930]|uniref:hypothetical protein n=1 Tax=Micromonospora sp. NPDC048930 TaxID=3364261 RepID=UPI003722EBCA
MADQTMPGTDGLIWYSTPHGTVGLVVRAAVVVGCAPYARRRALDRDARQPWNAAERKGINLAWLPEMHPHVGWQTAI